MQDSEIAAPVASHNIDITVSIKIGIDNTLHSHRGTQDAAHMGTEREATVVQVCLVDPRWYCATHAEQIEISVGIHIERHDSSSLGLN